MRRLTLVTLFVPSLVAAEPLHGDVQVWQDATLYLAPSDRAPTVRLAPLPHPGAASTGMTIPMRVVGERDGFIEITTEHLDDRVCHSWAGLEVDSRIELHLFVRREDLAPVVTRTWSHAFPDGTQLSLAPGAPIGPAVAGGRTLALSAGSGKAPAELVADVPADAIGLAFASTPRSIGSDADHAFEVTTRTIAVGGHRIDLDHALPLIARPSYRGDRALVALELDCAKLVAAVPRANVRPYKPPADDGPYGGLIGSERGAPLASFIPKGTPLSAADGSVIASASEDFALPTQTGKRLCGQFSIALERVAGDSPPPSSIELCAPASALVVRQVPPLVPSRPPPASRRLPSARIEHLPTTATGGGAVSRIRAVIIGSDDALLACYTAAHDRAPDLAGKIAIHFSIGMGGEVVQVSTTGLDAAAPCIAGVFHSAHFARPDGLVQVDYGLEFELR